MKIKKIRVTIVLLLTIFTETSYSKTINVSAADFSFSPATIDAFVGDTIKWNWINGDHTTTCNGSGGSTRPTGADPWNSSLNSGSPTFSYVVTVEGSYHYICTPHAPSMTGNINVSPSAIIPLNELVTGFEISQNYPNPFNPKTNIKFSVPNSSIVTLKIYNSMGQEIETLINEKLNAGSYKVDWNAINFTSGVYYYKIQVDEFIETRKMLLIK